MNEPCQGKNCGTTTAQHSAECQQETEEHFAMIEVLRAFEVWLKSDFPEADLSRLPSFAYRTQSVRDMWRAWQAAVAYCDNGRGLAACVTCGEPASLGDEGGRT